MPNRDRHIPAVVKKIAGAAASLNPQERRQLIRLLYAQGTGPGESFAQLQAGLRSINVYISNYEGLRDDVQRRVIKVCEQLETAVEAVEGSRAQQAVIDALLRAASKRCAHATGRNSGILGLHPILRVLETISWAELWGDGFPGYDLQLLGRVHCKG